MRVELSHDILAKKVYEKSSSDDKMLRKAETFIRERHEYFLAQGVMLGKLDLEYINPYLKDVDITAQQEKFIANSRKKVKRSEGRKIINGLLLIVLPILLGLLGWALYQTHEANQALSRVKIEKKRADKKAKEAKEAQALALDEKRQADIERAKAEESKDIAVQQSQIAAQQRAIAEKQAQRAAKEAQKAKAAAAEAEKQKKLAEAAAKKAEAARIEANKQAELAKDNAKAAKAAKARADELAKEATRLKEIADKEAARAKNLAEIAIQKEREARALYLASLADNALRLDKGIIAYNLAKTSWELDKNLMAQKVLFDCQNTYISDKSIFQEYQKQNFKSYVEQSQSRSDIKSQQKNLNTWGSKFRNRISFDGPFDLATFSPDRLMIATILFRKKRVKIRSTSDGQLISDIKTDANVKAIQFSQNNKYILLILDDYSSELRKIDEEGSLLGKFQHEAPITSAEFCPNSNETYIATVSNDKTAKLWNGKGTLIKEFSVFYPNFEVLPYIDGERVLTLDANGLPQLLNVKTNEATTFKVKKNSRDDSGMKAVFSPDGSVILTQTQDGNVELWNTDGSNRASINHKGKLDVAKFSPSGKEVLTSSASEQFAELWDLKGNSIGRFYYNGLDPINSVEFSNDGLRVLISRTAIANLWGVRGRLLYSFDPKKPIASASFSSDNKSVLVATKDGALDIWNIVRPEEIIDYYDNVVRIRGLTDDEILEYSLKVSDFK